MHSNRMAVSLLVLLAASLSFAQAGAPTTNPPQNSPNAGPSQPAPTIATVLDNQLKSIERQFVPAAEAMPEDKYAFAPTSGEFKGVRNFATQVKHVATANYIFAAAILGEKPPVEAPDENGPKSVQSKADIVKYVKDSYTYAHKAFQQITNDNAVASIPSPFGKGQATRLGLAVLTVAHGFDHYGQMVEYLRMNGIVPPASRKP